MNKYDKVEKKVNKCKKPFERLDDKLDNHGVDELGRTLKDKNNEPELSLHEKKALEELGYFHGKDKGFKPNERGELEL